MKLSELDIHRVGTEIQLVGVLYADRDNILAVPLPGEDGLAENLTHPTCLKTTDKRRFRLLEMDSSDWERFIQQTDRVEVMAIVKDEHGKVGKALVRKTARQVSQNVSWSVYRRDHLRCRYCGENTVPLTVDHLVLWEDGGPSIEANLVACCRRCNKTRGNMQYDEWLRSRYYKKVSRNLPPMIQEANERLVQTLPNIPRNPLEMKRKR